MSSAAGSRTPRAGAHRATRTAPPEGGSTRDKAKPAGIFGSRLRPKPVARISALAVLAALVGFGVAAGGGSSAEQTVYNFLLDWQQDQYHQAAALTTGQPGQVATELADSYKQVGATSLTLKMGRINQHGNSATAGFTASFDLGNIGQQWQYDGQFRLREDGSDWKVIWSPSVIVPGLRAGERLGASLRPQGRALILASGGQPLIVFGPAVEIGVTPNMLKEPAATVASQLAQVFEPDLNPADVTSKITEAQTKKFQELVTLTPAQYAAVAKRIALIPGLQVKFTMQRLFASLAPDVTGTVGTEIAAVLRQDGTAYLPGTTVGLSGLQQKYNSRLTGSPSISVYAQDSVGALFDVRAINGIGGLALWLGAKPTDVRTTINYRVQMAADDALANFPDSAAIVAIQPGTGKIMGVASHQVAGEPALQPLSGEYHPGQAFTIISTAALLDSGQVTPNSPQPCLPSSLVNGVPFVNDPPQPTSLEGASTVVSKDFEVGCSSAFAALSYDLHASQLASAAEQFGIGTDWQLPLPSHSYYQGAMGPLSAPDDIAEDTIGQGKVEVSPLAMALAAGAVASGRWHAPELVTDPADSSDAPKTVMTARVLTELRALMKDEVAHGSGLPAAIGKNVYAQSGNAAFPRRGYRISWFVGYERGIAFAVAELVSSSADSAAPLAGTFLGNLHAGS
jgi:cell division protein FtsI/penicillin-binding protein 2